MKHRFTTKISTLLSIATLLMVVGCGVETQVVSTETLLKEMVDKRDVTYFPEHYYTTKQFSSYDRASDKGDPTDYSWFANSDCSFFIGQDTIGSRIENVMYDAQGPGAVTRIWFTGGGPGLEDAVIRFYIDGAKEPALEGKVFELLGDNKAIGYPMNSILNRGHNSYLPIPYGKHCKITYESEFFEADTTKSQMFYYNINYRTYEDNTIVQSFTKNTIDSLQTLIKETNAALLSPDGFARRNKTVSDTWNVSLAPEQTESKIIDQRGTALSEIRIKLKAEDMEQALRSTILKISFDGNQTVWCPVGDFFATGHIWRESKTWSTTVDPKSHTLTANWVMPFKRNCEVSIENLGAQDVELDMELTQCEYEWSHSSMYFGSSWHQYTAISTGENKERIGKGGAVDLNYINLFGKGVFVGDALSVYNPALAGHWKTWWGEGDEKIYVDEEAFPSHFGTGTEDYYGYAWCIAASFYHPFVAQPIGEGNLSPGYTVNSRFRALDVIPFKSSLRLDMELWHWVKTTVNYAPTTFYYMLPGGSTNIEIDTEGAMAKIARHRFDVLTNKPDENGLLEGEDLKVADSIFSQVNGYYSDNVSGGLALQWHQAKRGTVLDAEFGVAQEGEYEVIVGMLKKPKLATVSLSINGESVLSSFVCDAKEFSVEEVNLGQHNLSAEGNKLSIKVNQQKNGRVAIDYIKIVKVQ